MLSKHLELLKKLNLSVRTQMDIAECYVPAINRQIENIAALDLLPNLSFAGSVILDRAYGPNGPQDSGQFIQAVLLFPDGIGICIWDSEEYLEVRKNAEFQYELARARFQHFDKCEPAIKGLLLAHADKLLDRLLKVFGEPGKKKK